MSEERTSLDQFSFPEKEEKTKEEKSLEELISYQENERRYSTLEENPFLDYPRLFNEITQSRASERRAVIFHLLFQGRIGTQNQLAALHRLWNSLEGNDRQANTEKEKIHELQNHLNLSMQRPGALE